MRGFTLLEDALIELMSKTHGEKNAVDKFNRKLANHYTNITALTGTGDQAKNSHQLRQDPQDIRTTCLDNLARDVEEGKQNPHLNLDSQLADNLVTLIDEARTGFRR